MNSRHIHETPATHNDPSTIARERYEYELLFDIARTFDKHVELRSALGQMLSLLEIRAELRNGMVTLLDRATGFLKVEEAFGLRDEEKARGNYRLGEGLVGRVFETAEGITVPDLSQNAHFLNKAKNRSPGDLKGLTYYCVPICSKDSVIGTLSAERYIQNKDPSSQMMWDRAFLEKTALIIADSAKLRERILEEQFLLSSHKSGAPLPGPKKPDGENSGGRLSPECPIIGTSSVMQALYEMVKQVAPSNATVMISGESGTGKELIAAEVHRLSKRAAKPMIKVNCAALPESIIESELFGHEKGAFTGAHNQRKGRFELANGGTIFLDEIGEISPQVQVKLLRVLQERELERVGGTTTVKVDVRLIAATNRKLEDEVSSGKFREDLFYRLNVFPLRVPPLRERKSDILLLADYFTEKYAGNNNKLIKRISTPALDLLSSYHWPGNVRELENCIERAVILSTDMVIHSYNLPPSLQSAGSTDTGLQLSLNEALSRMEKELIVEALKMCSGNMAAASRQLGITERQIGLRVSKYKIDWRLYRQVKI